MKVWAFIAVGIVCVILFQNCGEVTSPEDGAEYTYSLDQTIQTKLSEIEQTADLSCSADADCASLPAGAMACGGPTYHQIFSSTGTDLPKLQLLIDQYSALERLKSSATGLVSACGYPVPPNLGCIQNLCSEI